MLNECKLKAKMVENRITIAKMAETLGMNLSTFYRKCKNNTFSIKEADVIAKALNLTSNEASAIFFSQYVA